MTFALYYWLFVFFLIAIHAVAAWFVWRIGEGFSKSRSKHQ